nr:DUF2848 domain-containing protein [Komagataeibacter nataicola]
MDIGEVRDVIVAGWAGRNPADVQHHIAELEMLGVAPPSTVPLFYRVSADILTQAENIVVVGEQTSGEAEPVLLRTATGLYVGIGSDHTDRFCENFSVALSKQVCPKVVGTCFWRYEDVIGHWDELRLRSYRHEGAQRILVGAGLVVIEVGIHVSALAVDKHQRLVGAKVAQLHGLVKPVTAHATKGR